MIANWHRLAKKETNTVNGDSANGGLRRCEAGSDAIASAPRSPRKPEGRAVSDRGRLQGLPIGHRVSVERSEATVLSPNESAQDSRTAGAAEPGARSFNHSGPFLGLAPYTRIENALDK
jgi:hypothetical protein